MEFDDIVIGSGLSALGVVLGLPRERRVLVLGGPAIGHSQHYDLGGRVPCAHLGHGGLGNYWHGVIPTGSVAPGEETAEFVELFRYFYPDDDLADRLGKHWLFVPWRAIRPPRVWLRLMVQRGDRLRIAHEAVSRFAVEERRVTVHTDAGVHSGQRVWVCAGALHSPRLLDRSLEARVSRPTVSDHVICYIGQFDRHAPGAGALPRVQRTRGGVWFEASRTETALCTLRPAHFGFRRLDYGIEQRSVFGLPTGSLIRKLLRRASPGLLAEALYNRAGLLQNARTQSVYAQIVVPDAHWLREGEPPLVARAEVVQAVVRGARAACLRPHWTASRRPEIFIPAIHLHHSVDVPALRAAGANTPDARVQVVDASVHEAIGPEHHSFRVMAAACAAARRSELGNLES